MNQVSGSGGGGSEIKTGTINPHNGCLQYSNEGPYILLIGIKIPRRFDVILERK